MIIDNDVSDNFYSIDEIPEKQETIHGAVVNYKI